MFLPRSNDAVAPWLLEPFLQNQKGHGGSTMLHIKYLLIEHYIGGIELGVDSPYTVYRIYRQD